MRWFTVPAKEAAEAGSIPAVWGKTYQPHGQVTLGPENVVDAGGAELVEVRGEALAVHPDAGAWAFLEPDEAAVFRRLHQARLSDLPDGSAALVADLYRRGLVAVNGHRAVDPAMFEDSPNHAEGHLVELLVTERCNLGCVYCLAGTTAKMPAMTSETGRRAVDLAFGMDAPTIGFEFSGGEPFLRFDLMCELVDYIEQHPRRAGRAVYLSAQSNGTLLNRERVEWMREHRVTIGLSLDGEPWAQNVSRPMLGGGASYDALMRGIDLLRAGGMSFGALVVLSSANIGNAEELLAFLVRNDVRSIKLNPVAFLGTARANWEDTGLSQEEIVAFFRDVVRLVGGGGYGVREANLHAMIEHLVSKRRATRCVRGHCGAGDTFQAVSAAGDIYPCGRATQSPGLKLGNVADPHLQALSGAATGNRHVLQIRARRPHTLEGCESCTYRQFCQSGCSAQAFERYGTVRHRTPECHFYKTLYPELMHTLTFDGRAFTAFDQIGYLGGGGRRIERRHAIARS